MDVRDGLRPDQDDESSEGTHHWTSSLLQSFPSCNDPKIDNRDIHVYAEDLDDRFLNAREVVGRKEIVEWISLSSLLSFDELGRWSLRIGIVSSSIYHSRITLGAVTVREVVCLSTLIATAAQLAIRIISISISQLSLASNLDCILLWLTSQ